LLKFILDNGVSYDFTRLIENDIDEYHFSQNDKEREAFRYIQNYLNTYSELPDISIVEAETGCVFPAESPSAPFQFWLDKVKKRKVIYFITNKQNELIEQLGNEDFETALNTTMEIQNALSGSGLVRKRLYSQEETIELIARLPEELDHGCTSPGVLTGLPQLDEKTRGLLNGDLWVLTAPTGQGKSFMCLKIAIGANLSGYKVLFVTMEMTAKQLAIRNMSLQSSIPSDWMRRGLLSCFGVRYLQNYLEQLNQSDRANTFHYYEGKIKMSVTDIASYIQLLAPDLVIIDGAYMLHPTSKYITQYWEKQLTVMQELRQMSLDFNIPFLTTYQYSGKVNIEKAGLSDIMGGQAIGHYAPVVIKMYPDKSSIDIDQGGENTNRTQYKILEILKGREGESGNIRVRFDLQNSTIEEVNQ
jgi:replicative DNA helicase